MVVAMGGAMGGVVVGAVGGATVDGVSGAAGGCAGGRADAGIGIVGIVGGEARGTGLGRPERPIHPGCGLVEPTGVELGLGEPAGPPTPVGPPIHILGGITVTAGAMGGMKARTVVLSGSARACGCCGFCSCCMR